ncbi:MAG TPA: isoprenyl transferase [Allosphingosinicella sp.]
MRAGAAPATPENAAGAAEPLRVPRHLAIIMDGNGRWAKARGLPRAAGHKQGAEAARRAVRAAGELGIECLTLYAFSSENWRRPATEINDLTGILRFYLQRELENLHREGVRIRVLGDHRAFAPDVARMVDHAIERTAGNSRMTVAVALNYGARGELVRAMQALAQRAAAGTLDAARIDEAMIDAQLDTSGLPPLDLMIRTSGEYRLSNFLLWQAAYAELIFTDTLWPDFDGEALKAALAEFGRRERRYGGL